MDIRNQWGFDAYFSSYTSNARGVAILFNNNFEFKILNEKKDENGNLLALNIRIANKTITLITIYAPNADSPVFFENVSHILDEFNNDDIILVGDYNLFTPNSTVITTSMLITQGHEIRF